MLVDTEGPTMAILIKHVYRKLAVVPDHFAFVDQFLGERYFVNDKDLVYTSEEVHTLLKHHS